MKNYSFKKINDDTQLIITGETYPDGGAIEIYLRKNNDGLFLTDLGFTTLWLLNLGFKTNIDSDILIFDNNNDIQLSGGEIILKIKDLKSLNKNIESVIHSCNKFISFYKKDNK